MYITNKNDMAVFARCIEDVDADSILDVGMFFKRIGATARNLFSVFEHKSIILHGVSDKSNASLGLYTTLYDEVYKEVPEHKMYDLTTMLRCSQIYTPDRLVKMYSMIRNISKVVMMDRESYAYINENEKRVIFFSASDNDYVIIICGEL